MFFLSYMILTICIMLGMAFFTLVERKILGLLHFRKGPNKVSLSGILQPIADAMKLIFKDNRPVSKTESFFFLFSPIFMMMISLLIWSVFPFWKSSLSLNYSLLYTFIFLSLGVYSLVFSGFFSKSKYALLGALRAVSQTLSYEVVLSFLFLIFILMYKSASFLEWVTWKNFFFLKLPLLFIFVLTTLAEMNRAPFDLSEGESELVSGYSVEYGGISFTFVFLSENIMIFFSAFITSFCFFDWDKIYFLKWSILCFFYVLLRGIVPRIRYDVLMFFCWKVLTPILIYFLVFYFSIVEVF